VQGVPCRVSSGVFPCTVSAERGPVYGVSWGVPWIGSFGGGPM
jgi:hypothetical protein